MKTLGIVLTLVGIFLGIQLGSNVAAFIDIPAMLFVMLVGFGILVAAHGIEDVFATLFKIAGREPRVETSAVAETGITAFVAAGWMGTLVGVVQLLSALDDPAKLGLGTAVALMSAFYGYVAGYAICFPISRQKLTKVKCVH